MPIWVTVWAVLPKAKSVLKSKHTEDDSHCKQISNAKPSKKSYDRKIGSDEHILKEYGTSFCEEYLKEHLGDSRSIK